MGAQQLNDRSTRRIERATGLVILRAWAHGGYTHDFVTPDHRHGWFDTKTGEWEYDETIGHYRSCHEMFPDEVKP